MKELWTNEEAEYHGRFYDFPPVRSFPRPFQRPHPPVLLGSKGRYVFERVIEWGDGWMPIRVSAEDIRRGRATLDELAEKSGPDPTFIEVMAFGQSGEYGYREVINDLGEAGADRVTIWLTHTEGKEAMTEMEEISREVLP